MLTIHNISKMKGTEIYLIERRYIVRNVSDMLGHTIYVFTVDESINCKLGDLREDGRMISFIINRTKYPYYIKWQNPDTNTMYRKTIPNSALKTPFELLLFAITSFNNCI